AIQGQVANHDGTPCEEFNVSIIIVEKPPGMGDEVFLDVETRQDVPGKFLTQQLPLGGKYRIFVNSKRDDSVENCLSEPLILDEQTPIQALKMQFPEGKQLVVRLVDVNHKAASNVGIQFRYEITEGRTSRGFSKSGVTNTEGIAIFEHVNWKCGNSHQLEIAPAKTWPGHSIKLVPSQTDVSVQLKSGLSGAGVVVDVATGLPVPALEIRLAPKDYQQPGYLGWINARTDAQGEFHLENLERREYRFYIDNADPVGTIYTPLPDGRHSITRQGEFPTLQGGTKTPIRIEVQLRPDRK
ncbi:MAG: antirepressor regulating drug resistance protein, partial [Planctomycetaceae bacterium]|nr:antirepressor regulating drug resistance protein [Planctomycetaceae bacterium]